MRLWGLFTNIVLDSLDKGEAQYSFTIDVRTKNLSQSKNLPDRLFDQRYHITLDQDKGRKKCAKIIFINKKLICTKGSSCNNLTTHNYLSIY